MREEDERTADRGGEAGTNAHADCREYPLRACPRDRGVTWTARRVGHESRSHEDALALC